MPSAVSRAEAIAQYVVSLLQSEPVAGIGANDVVRDPLHVAQSSVVAAIVVEIGDEPKPEQVANDAMMRTLDLTVGAIVKGSAARSSVDSPSLAAHQRIIGAGNLGGLAFEVKEGQVERDYDYLEKPVAQIRRHYEVRYYTETGVIT